MFGIFKRNRSVKNHEVSLLKVRNSSQVVHVLSRQENKDQAKDGSDHAFLLGPNVVVDVKGPCGEGTPHGRPRSAAGRNNPTVIHVPTRSRAKECRRFNTKRFSCSFLGVFTYNVFVRLVVSYQVVGRRESVGAWAMDR